MANTLIQEYVPEECVADKEALLPAFLSIWNDAENLKYVSFTMRPFEEEVVRGWYEDHKKRGVQYFCAQNAQQEILGIVTIEISPIEGFEIRGIAVRPRYKRQGIGCALIEHAIALATKLEYKFTKISIFADNAAMLIMAISHGFIPCGIEYNRRADGADIVHLKKYI